MVDARDSLVPFFARLENCNMLESMGLYYSLLVSLTLPGALSCRSEAIVRAARLLNHLLETFAQRFHSIRVILSVALRIIRLILANEPAIFLPKSLGCDAADWVRLNHPVCTINPIKF